MQCIVICIIIMQLFCQKLWRLYLIRPAPPHHLHHRYRSPPLQLQCGQRDVQRDVQRGGQRDVQRAV